MACEGPPLDGAVSLRLHSGTSPSRGQPAGEGRSEREHLSSAEAVLGACPQAFPAAGGWVGYPP